MKVIKNHLDKPKNEKNKHGGAQLESMLIEKYADQWCRDNGYPIRERIVHRGRAAAQYGQKCGQNVSKKRQ